MRSSLISKRVNNATMFVALFLTGFVVSCLPIGTLDLTITFYQNQEWKVENHLILDPQEAFQYGTTVEAELQKQAANLKTRVDYRWRKEKSNANTTYIITVEGKGLQLLNELAFSNQATITSDGNTVTISYQEIGLSGMRPLVLRLTGSKIISSNANKIEGNTAIWYNVKYGDTVQATLTAAPKGGSGDTFADAIKSFFQAILDFIRPKPTTPTSSQREPPPLVEQHSNDPRLQWAVDWAKNQSVEHRQDWFRDGQSYCEEFVENAYGVTLKFKNPVAAFSQYGVYADPALPGLIVIFQPTCCGKGTNGGNGHAGIYIGDGLMISAADNGVQQDSVNWWSNNVAPLAGYIYPPREWPGIWGPGAVQRGNLNGGLCSR